MKLQNLTVQERDGRGKGPARRARAAGQVPVVLYGGSGENCALAVDAKVFSHVLHTGKGEHALVQLEVEGNPSLNGPAMVKEVQHDPIRGHVVHADLLRIRLDEKIRTLTPIVFVGRAKGVIEGGLLDHQLRELEIECLALDVPDSIQVNVSELAIGDSIHVSELATPEGVTVVTPGDRAVAAVHAPRVAATAEEEAAAAAAAAEGAAAEGEAAKAKEGEEKEGKEKEKK